MGDELHALRSQVSDTRVAVARVEGDIQAIRATLTANAEQRTVMTDLLTEIRDEAKKTNGRLRAAEGEIIWLKNGQSTATLEALREVLADGSVSLPVIAHRPPMTKAKKAGIVAIVAACLPQLIDAFSKWLSLLHGAGH